MMGEQSQVGNSIDWTGQWVGIAVRFRRVNVSGVPVGISRTSRRERERLGNTRGCFLFADGMALCKWFPRLPCVKKRRIQLGVRLRQDEPERTRAVGFK